MIRTSLAIVVALGAVSAPAWAQSPAEPRIAAQRQAMAALAWMDGRWQGPATRADRTGKIDMTQTERVGPFLDGSVRIVEGKAFDPAGKPNGFNALGVVSYDPDTRAYTFTTFAQGYSQAVPLEVTPAGWSWSLAAGPGRQIRYTASNAGGRWTERGVMTGPGMPPAGVEVFSMALERRGTTDWPAAGSATAPGG